MPESDLEHVRPAPASKDAQTVDGSGDPIRELIHGVRVRALLSLPDGRGAVCELYRVSWQHHDAPLVQVYEFTIRPGVTKGWVLHRRQDDRLVTLLGTVQAVLYDGRAGSPTFGAINELCFSERNRSLLTVPAGVYHALRNVGVTDATLLNMPTREYDYADPDKYRLPLDTDQIPYRFR